MKLFKASDYDVIVIEKELLPYFPPVAEWLLGIFKVRYIVDYDDAIFHNYDLNPNKVLRKILGNKIVVVIKNAALVVAGNNYLANYAIKSKARNVSIIPTVVNVEKYSIVSVNKSIKEQVIIGWIGSPSTLQYLRQIAGTLKEICNKYQAKVHIIGGKGSIGLGPAEEIIDWSEEQEISLIQACDIGIMPLENTLWAQGKCGYKLIQYMACGLPVIASPVGVNDDIIQEGVNGFKATNNEEWYNALELLIENSILRKKTGAAGRQLVEKEYSYQKFRSIWLELLQTVNN
jgi:glycosyltransferase involved in cell wall biosynthesis